MSTINGISSGSNKIGSPFTIGITAANYSHLDLSFHTLKLEVRAYLYDGDEQQIASSTVTMSTPTQEGEKHDIDISSALRTATDNYEFSPTLLVQPHLYCAIVASDEYMTTDGVVHKDGYQAQYIYPDNWKDAQYNAATGVITYTAPTKVNGVITPAITHSLLTIGAYNDLERLTAGNFKNLLRASDSHQYSRKPTDTAELVYVEDYVVVPSACDRSTAHKITTAGGQSVGGHPFYALPADSRHYQMRFVNGLGLIESVSVNCERKVSASATSTQYMRTTVELFGAPSRSIYQKQPGRETWQMSSGPLTEAWNRWWQHEFAMTQAAWIWLNNRWLPVHIIPDDKTDLVESTKVGMLTYNFNLQFDIDGPVLSPLTV